MVDLSLKASASAGAVGSQNNVSVLAGQTNLYFGKGNNAAATAASSVQQQEEPSSSSSSGGARAGLPLRGETNLKTRTFTRSMTKCVQALEKPAHLLRTQDADQWASHSSWKPQSLRLIK